MSEHRVICVASQKGGVTKTVVCQHLSHVLANWNYRVLAVDLDAQSNLTASLIPAGAASPQYTINDLFNCLLTDKPFPAAKDYIAHTCGVDFILGSKELYRQEVSLRMEMGSERFLSAILSPLRSCYDYIIIDTNRADSPLLINALTAADSVLIPACPSFYSIEGLSDLVATVLKNRRRLNPALTFEGILFSNCEERTRLYRGTRADVQEAFGTEIPLFRTSIPHTVQVEEAVRRGMTVLEYAPNCKASIAFRALGKEVIAHGSEVAHAKTASESQGNSARLLVG